VTVVEAPVTGLPVGVLENPVVTLGDPLCHVIKGQGMQERITDQQAGTTHRTTG
jgi:hypothetical protein